MSSMLFLALLIVLVSGLIAYVGDLIGRKMGRKRLTLLGLRPRHTAIVISVGMGMLIAALTLATTFAVSQGVRDAFFTPLSQLREKLTTQKQALQHTEQELDVTRRRSRLILQQFQEETRKLNDANDRLAKAMKQRGEVQTRLLRARGELASIQQQLRQNQQKLAENERRLMIVDHDLMASRTKLKATEKQLVASGQQLLKVNEDLDVQKAALGTFLRMNFAPLAFASGQEILSGVIPARESDVTRKALLRKFLMVAEHVVRRNCADLPAGDAAIVFLARGG